MVSGGEMVGVAIVVLMAAAVTAGTVPPLRSSLTRVGLVAAVEPRSSHRGSIPAGGGVAVLIGALSALATGLATQDDGVGDVVAGAAVMVVLALLGLVDDLHTLPAGVRLILQVVVAGGYGAAVVGPGGWSVLATIGVLVVVVAFVNVFNFIDGINGIAAGSAAVIGGILGAAGLLWGEDSTAVLLFALAGGATGFLPFNFPRATIFLGDTGSYALGAGLVVGAVLLVRDGVPLLAIGAPFVPIVADTFSTIALRIRRRENLFEAHRLHAYQVWAHDRWGHARTTLVFVGLTSFCGVVGLAAAETGFAGQLLAGVLIAVPTGAFVSVHPRPSGAPDRAPDRPSPMADGISSNGS